jgi:mannose/cellobiose epimerase-like protein (N-acyl-D-glucosamine 2-epimerase family)
MRDPFIRPKRIFASRPLSYGIFDAVDDQTRQAEYAEQPAVADADLAAQAKAALRRHVLQALLPRCVDRQYGGFLVDFDERWRPAGPHTKTLEHATRTTMAFALLDEALPGEGCDQLVRHGCEFLQHAMWDAAHGGFFAQVDRSGQPQWNGLKHPHAVTYAVRTFLLAERFLPVGEGVSWAERALAWLDDVAWDPVNGGYWGCYRRDNERYPDGACLPTPDGRDPLGVTPGFKEINTQSDAIETLTVLAGRGWDRAAKRLAWLMDLVVDHLSDAAGILPYLYRHDWRPVPDLLRVGSVFQLAHRLVYTATLRGETAPVARGCDLIDFALSRAHHPAGGFCCAVTADGRTWPATNPASDLRQWWVQFEAIRALHVFANHEAVGRDARDRYRRARDAQWAFVRDHLLDTRYGGIREFPLEPTSRLEYIGQWLGRDAPVRRLKTYGWKDPSHEVGAFIALATSRNEIR